MAHLPNEIWLQVLGSCDPRDIWLSLRRVNQQLKACAEKSLYEYWLQDTVLKLPITLPSYDMRNPIRGMVFFMRLADPDPAKTAIMPPRLSFRLSRTSPEHHLPHFISRWKSMRDSKVGRLSDRTPWELEMCRCFSAVRLGEPVIDLIDDGKDGNPLVAFDWMATTTSFYR